MTRNAARRLPRLVLVVALVLAVVAGVMAPSAQATPDPEPPAAATASLTGIVSGSAGPLADVSLTLSGGGLPAPVVATTGGDGAYALTGLPAGDGYRVALQDPSGTHVDQVVGELTLPPDEATELDLWLSPDVPLPPGQSHSVGSARSPVERIIRLADGGYAASTSDEVLVFDDQVRLLARVQVTIPFPGGVLFELGGGIWVHAEDRLLRIDGSTWAIDRDLGLPSDTGSGTQLAAAGGRIWFTPGQWVPTAERTLRAIDPITGAVTTTLPMPCRCSLTGIEGTQHLLVWSRYLPITTQVIDVAGEPTVVASSTERFDEDVAIASATAGVAWGSNGFRLDLDTLTATRPVTVSGGNQLAMTPDGKTVWFGDAVISTPTGGVLLPWVEAGAFLPGRDALLEGDGNRIEVTSLRPQVWDLDPAWLAPASDATVVLRGRMLGAAEEVLVDGTPVGFAPTGELTLELDLPASVTDVPAGTALPIDVTTTFGSLQLAADLHVGTSVPTAPLDVWTHTWDSDPPRGQVSVSWDAPDEDGRLPILGYELRRLGSDEIGWLALDDLDEREDGGYETWIRGLPSGGPIEVQVRAVNALGPGPWGSSPPFTLEPPTPYFADVPVSHPFFWEIQHARFVELAQGFPDGTFHPTDVVSRQAAIAFLWRDAGYPGWIDWGVEPEVPPFPDPGFSDVGADHPFRTAIWWAASEGIVAGYPDGTFRGGASVTRQAWMAFQWRAEGEPPVPGGCTESFTDVGPTHPFRTPILWAACADITNGYPDGTFRPTATVTRQAAIAFLVRPTWPQWEPVAAP